MEGCLREPGGRGRRQTQPTPWNKLARLDYQKGKVEGMEVASHNRGNIVCLREGGWK